MTRFIMKTLRRFRDSEDGSSVVPFALWTPVFLALVLSSIELGVVTLRHTTLERALDQTVRDVRLGTGTNYTHESLKQSICEKAPVLPDCMNMLQLEMVKLNMRQWSAPPASADCVDTAQAVNPLRSFEYGRDNEMMMLRACYKFKPISPSGGLAANLPADANGYTAVVSTSAFVQEPS